jgi:dGTPase
LEQIRRWPQRLVALSSEFEEERRSTKEFLYGNLYYSTALQPEKEDAERIITGLFELWMNYPEKLPASYQEKIESETPARVICDYIAGMTDTYIYEQYQKHSEAMHAVFPVTRRGT